MKKLTIYIVAIAFAFVAADPAAAWFWEKKKVESPEVASQVEQESGEGVREVKKKGLWTRIKESFSGVKEDVKKSGKGAKEGFKGLGQDFKKAGKKVGEDSKKLPGELKKSGKAIGQEFKKLGKDASKETKEVFVGEEAESAK